MRIVSLLPSATEIVCVLGLEELLIGVSADSDWPPHVVERLPVLNTVALDSDAMTSREIDAAASTNGHSGASLYHVDADLLRELRPDVILTQEICEVCAVSRRDVDVAARTLGYAPRVLSLSPVTLGQMLEDIDMVARAAGVPERSADLTCALRARLDLVRARTASLPRPAVFCMEWLDPPYSAGHWVPEMVEFAGGRDHLGAAGGFSRQVAWAEVIAYQPQVLVLMPCSLELERVAREFEQLRRLPGWDTLPAVQSGQVYAGHTHLFSRSGPRLVDGVETLARVLHAEAFREPLPVNYALRVSLDGQRLEPFQ